MGTNVVNSGGWFFREPGWTENRYQLRHHQESLDIDDWSVVFDQTEAASIKAAAAVSQLAFDLACEGVVGQNWYRPRPTEWKQLLRAGWLGLP